MLRSISRARRFCIRVRGSVRQRNKEKKRGQQARRTAGWSPCCAGSLSARSADEMKRDRIKMIRKIKMSPNLPKGRMRLAARGSLREKPRRSEPARRRQINCRFAEEKRDSRNYHRAPRRCRPRCAPRRAFLLIPGGYCSRLRRPRKLYFDSPASLETGVSMLFSSSWNLADFFNPLQKCALLFFVIFSPAEWLT